MGPGFPARAAPPVVWVPARLESLAPRRTVAARLPSRFWAISSGLVVCRILKQNRFPTSNQEIYHERRFGSPQSSWQNRGSQHTQSAQWPTDRAQGLHAGKRVAIDFSSSAPACRPRSRSASGPDDVRRAVAWDAVDDYLLFNSPDDYHSRYKAATPMEEASVMPMFVGEAVVGGGASGRALGHHGGIRDAVVCGVGGAGVLAGIAGGARRSSRWKETT